MTGERLASHHEAYQETNHETKRDGAMYKISEAVKATGVSKATIHRARENGKISASKDENGHYQFDPAELHRVFPRRTDTAHNTPNDAARDAGETAKNDSELSALAAKLEVTEKLVDAHAQTIEDLRDRLTKEGEERRQLTAMLTDQRNEKRKGFLARLMGA